MQRQSLALSVSLGISLIIWGWVTYFGLDSVWGLSHVKFLGDYSWYFIGLLAAVILLLAGSSVTEKSLERTAKSVAGWLWGKSLIPKIALSSFCTLIFYLFRVPTAFLGDGYFLLNIFGRNERYTADLIKPLSIGIIKTIQTLFGGYTYWTALYTFETVSIVSGFFVIYNFIAIVGMLTDSARGRLFALAMLIFSGWALLFFGYIEYYPLLWLAASFFIKQSIKCAIGQTRIWTVWLTFIVTIAIHMQAIYFLPGLLYLQFPELFSRLFAKFSAMPRWQPPLLLLVIVSVVVLAANDMLPSGASPFLPVLPIDAGLPNYAIFSLSNLMEIANLVLLCIPAVLSLLALVFMGGLRESDSRSRLLGLFSLGSLLFLAIMNPILGLARDWDLMSLTLLAPLLYLLYRVSDWTKAPVRILLAVSILSLGMTTSYLHANCTQESSERRIHDLLKHYGSKEKGGWVSLSRFLQTQGKEDFYNEVVSGMNEAFPDQRKYETALRLFASGKIDEAEYLANALIKSQPDNGEFSAVLADIRVGQGKFSEGIQLYHAAITTHPNHRNYFNLGRACLMVGNSADGMRYLEKGYQLAPENTEILTELCRAYASMEKLDLAKKYADELLAIDPRSPDGLIVSIIQANRLGRRMEAIRYYRVFLQHGRNHPEYETIKQAFEYLIR